MRGGLFGGKVGGEWSDPLPLDVLLGLDGAKDKSRQVSVVLLDPGFELMLPGGSDMVLLDEGFNDLLEGPCVGELLIELVLSCLIPLQLHLGLLELLCGCIEVDFDVFVVRVAGLFLPRFPGNALQGEDSSTFLVFY